MRMLEVSFGSLKQSADYNFRLEFLILPSSSRLKSTCDTRIIHFYYTLTDRARRRTKKLKEGKKRLSETEDHEKLRLATLKRLKRDDKNELERKLRLEKVVTSKQLRLAMETEEERRARLEDGCYHTAQVGPGDR